jgi:hypothetical protein
MGYQLSWRVLSVCRRHLLRVGAFVEAGRATMGDPPGARDRFLLVELVCREDPRLSL